MVERTLRESEERFRALFLNAPVAIYVHAADTFELLDANPHACRSFGVGSVAELLEADLWMEPPYSFADAIAWMQRASREGLQEYEWCSRRADGALFWEQLSLLKVPLSGIDRILVIATDITARKHAEEALIRATEQAREGELREAYQAGTIQMAGSVLHDIGNAITGMGAVLQQAEQDCEWPECAVLARMGEWLAARRAALAAALGVADADALLNLVQQLDQQLAGRVQRHREGSGRANAIIEHISSILSLQREYALGGLPTHKAEVRLSNIIDDALFMLEGSLQKTMVSIDREFSTTEGKVFGDRTALIQVFINLLKNACESCAAVDTGTRRIGIRLRRLPSGEGWQITLADNGCGIAAEDIGRLFERGFSTKAGGSGIGLPFVYSTIAAHGGQIGVHSDGPGHGAVFTITLPAAKQGASADG